MEIPNHGRVHINVVNHGKAERNVQSNNTVRIEVEAEKHIDQIKRAEEAKLFDGKLLWKIPKRGLPDVE